MDFKTCSKCLYGQANDLCEAFMIRHYCCDDGITEISWNGACPFYHESTETPLS
ncbi:hypothetical protein REC12_25080 [Desulfosporosinus sp. PR]|uniref:hypothetical protein n=1 Tax=Candidatus Desulfosporosinus nitrosoreducens TaxID=3401928 RepID=UPI0027F60E32|nr:hypothetical protein [Desulfosporosinus sp. PR]MDQ7096872.1 hypothetical protein [Desulfosporosinus sp. PR]